MADKFTQVLNCRMCDSSDLEVVLPLVSLPIGDKYVPTEDKAKVTEAFPLQVNKCKNCGHLQNSGFVNPEMIYEHYLSRPATTNPVLSGAYQEYISHLWVNYKPEGDIFLVEGGSNDGAFTKHAQGLGARVLGIEPAPNVAETANSIGVPTLCDYFTFELAKKIKTEHGAANFFIANHMFANVPTSSDFAKGVSHLLADDGVFAMQTNYHVDVLQKNLIENFTHEHLSYFYVGPFKGFVERHGMELIDVQRVPAKEGSIRWFVQKQGGPHPRKSSVDELLALEKEIGVEKSETYQLTMDFISNMKSKLHTVLDPIKAAGKSIAGFGTSTGATTFSFNYDLGSIFDFFVDDDPYRHNLVSPVYHIPVMPSKMIYEKKPDYVVILAPLYADIIMKKNVEYLKQGGKFIKIWPNFEIVESAEGLE
jgi:hypothetical protein